MKVGLRVRKAASGGSCIFSCFEFDIWQYTEEPKIPDENHNKSISTIVKPILVVVLMLYVSAYIVLSRRGYEEARRWDLEGFYYLSPEKLSPSPSKESKDHWSLFNGFFRVIYWPLNTIDCFIGFGMAPASDPLCGMG